MVEVTQADRQFAKTLMIYLEGIVEDEMLAGRYDDSDTMQAIARHRQAGIEEGLERAAAMVKALWREMKPDGESIPTDMLFSLSKDISHRREGVAE